MNSLKLGILLQSPYLKAWEISLLDTLNEAQYCDLALIITNGSNLSKSVSKSNKAHLLKNILYYGYSFIDRKIYSYSPDAFTKSKISLSKYADQVIEVVPKETKYTDRIQKEDINRIKEFQLDVIIRLGFRILKGEILKVAKYGIWSLHHGDNMINRGSPPGYWETINKIPNTCSVLQILSEDLDNGMVIYRSQSMTNTLSVNLNIQPVYWKSVSFIPRKLEELSRIGWDSFKEKYEGDEEPVIYHHPLYRVPQPWQAFKNGLRMLLRAIRYYTSKLWWKQQWHILYKFDKDAFTSIYQYKKLIPPTDRLWADPFVMYHEGIHHLFVEEMYYSDKKGHISHMVLDHNGIASEVTPIIKEKYHLSFPNIFKINETFFMIPESGNARKVQLYKCNDFPLSWTEDRVLLKDLNTVDTVVKFYEDRWWIFTNIAARKGCSTKDELHIYYTDDLLQGEILAHPQNPVVSDASNGRMAGKIFEHNGNLYRPAQNSSINYGYGFNFNKIVTLSPTSYIEELVSTVTPDWDKTVLSTHTYNRANGVTVIDALRRIPRFR